MRVVITNSSGEIDITQLITVVKWGGERTAVARKLEFGVLVSPSDYFIPKVDIKLGNQVKFYGDGGEELFRGYIFNRQKSYSEDEMNIVAYDGMIYLLKSKGIYNIKGMTPEALTKKICGDIGVPVGNVVSTGVMFSKVFNGVTYYDIIQTGYSEACLRNGKKYMPRMMQGKVEVIEKGATVVKTLLTNFDPNTQQGNITNSNFGESIENMVNRVLIVDDKGNKVGEIKDDSLMKLYGVIQDVYQKEKGKNPTPNAKALIKGVESTASIEAFGNPECITGMAVQVKDSYTGLVGKFFIENDQHVWQNGMYTMNLGLSFDNLMDVKN